MFDGVKDKASESDRIDNPYQSPIASLVPAPGKNRLTSPLRCSFTGAIVGGGLGGALVVTALVLLFISMAGAEDDEVGPMFFVYLPLVAVGCVMACTVIGSLVGALSGMIACVVTPPSQRRGPIDEDSGWSCSDALELGRSSGKF